ncbi:iron chelate uptake ABC transporter family permease subunit [Wenyingzhuangia sp. IMCC45533]
MLTQPKTYYSSFSLLFVILVVLCFLNISTGSVPINFNQVWKSVFFIEESNVSYIVNQYRIPKTLTSIITGAGLGISGLLMQTYFRNPLAGPFVLGISSGASLGVALLIMGSSFIGFSPLLMNFSIPISASLGSFVVLSVIMIAARNIKNTMSILIIGLMFGSFASAIISILSYFSSASELQQYIFWSFGSLGNLQWGELSILYGIWILSFIGLIIIIKPLDALLLGENYAKSLGVSLKKTEIFVFLITSLLTGSITAFVGPIAFIGLAIPHITKLIFKTSKHKTLLPAVCFVGAIVMLFCDTLSHINIANKTLPINAITSLFGAPVVVWLLISKSKKYS